MTGVPADTASGSTRWASPTDARSPLALRASADTDLHHVADLRIPTAIEVRATVSIAFALQRPVVVIQALAAPGDVLLVARFVFLHERRLTLVFPSSPGRLRLGGSGATCGN